ncbi:unnamed protein product, partial [Didymodactylos carnosus]
PLEYLFITGDLPALADMANFIRHGGYNACFVCLVPGVYDKDQGTVLYICDDIKERTNNDYYSDVLEAERRNMNTSHRRAHNGVFG